MKLVIATNNQNKVKEIGFEEEIPETQATIEGNSQQKASYLYDKTNFNCFADDTGLIIEALNNEPGVFSARYAGEKATSEDNMQLVLKKLQNIKNRKAKFKTVITLIINNKTYSFTGEIEGEITKEKSGKEGFGYDPIFKPKGYDVTFSEMSLEEKNKISHRALALEKLITFLNKL